jgi:anaerobic magnesium-protoporphyrin IX monomethyl ester cyclase
MRVLLTTLNAKYIHVNPAIRLLYQLNKDHKGLEWNEFSIKENKDEIAQNCSSYDVIAFSCYIWNITQTLEVAAKIKQLNPAAKILLGGPEVSYEWEEVLKLPQVDFIITGEGEIPFAKFLSQFPARENIPNLAYKQNEQIIYLQNSEQFDVANYADIMPYIDDPVETLANRVLYIETSRGCPYKCEFCLASLDNKVRYLPDVHIKNTLRHLMKHGRVIKFLDRTFNMKRDFTIDIFSFILENHRPGNVFQFEITADILHPDIIKFIHEKVPEGLFRFEIGIQTVNQKANLEVKRKQNFDKTKGIIEQLKNKIEMHLDLIVGLPLDYFEDVKYSFEEVFKLFAPELQLGFLKFLKGTPMRDKEQHGFVFDPLPPYQLIRSKYLSEEELNRVLDLEHALEVYWNKHRTINTLKYVCTTYSIFDFLMGLGKYFKDQIQNRTYSIKNVYEVMERFILENYSTDPLLIELLSFDFYIQHKVRPKPYLKEQVSKELRNEILKENNFRVNEFRHMVLPYSFDMGHFQKNNVILKKDSIVVVEYSGTASSIVTFIGKTESLEVR